MRWLTIVALALATFALVGAGCGGDDEESASDTTELTDTLTDETTTDEETTTDDDTDETTTDDDTDLSGVFEDEDCLALVAAVSRFAQAFGGQGVTDETEEAFAELAEKVPDEIEADVQVLAAAYTEFAAELEDIGLESGETPDADQLQQMQAAIASFGDEGVTEASERVSAWAQTNCASG